VEKRLKDGYGVCVTECRKGKGDQRNGKSWSYSSYCEEELGEKSKGLQRGNLDTNDIRFIHLC